MGREFFGLAFGQYSGSTLSITINSCLLLLLLLFFGLHWVFVAARGLSLVAASRGYSSLRCAGLIVVVSLVVEHRL